MPVAVIALAAVIAASQPNLAKVVLKPGAVGAGYVLLQRTDGKGTAQRTLDLCGTKNYPSESLRSDRLQVDYLKQNSALGLSNEVVTYKDAGAAQALREVQRHAQTCPSKPIAFEGQPPLVYHFTRVKDSKLLQGYVALRIDISGTIKGKAVRAIRYAVYQRFGNVLSGVYSYALAPGVSSATQQAFVLHAAEASAKALRGGSQGGGLPA
jgi:hypothetical protein